MTNISSLLLNNFVYTKPEPRQKENENSFKKDVFFEKMDKLEISQEAKEAIWISFQA